VQKLARKFGGQGIGLCRTERMFNGADRIGLFVDMIMAENIEERKKVLKKIRVNYKKVISLKF